MGVLGVPWASRLTKPVQGRDHAGAINPWLYPKYSIRGTETTFMIVGPGKKFSALQS